MNKKPQITVIGAVNIDLIGYAKYPLITKDDNIGHIETILGGVGRNIAENLARLDCNVHFLTVFGEDEYAAKIMDSCAKLNISVSHSLQIKKAKTSTFMAIMDVDNDMELGLSSMGIYDQIPDSFITNNAAIITNNEFCVIETNLPQNILELVVNSYPKLKFVLDAVSGTKALKAKNILSKLYLLKCNLIEATLLSELPAKTEEEYQKIVQYFIQLGIKKVFITLGKNGFIYGDTKGIYRTKITNNIPPINTTGAGDAFMAGLVFAAIQQKNIHAMAKTASACAELTIQHKHTVHPNMNKEYILKQTND